MLCNSLVVHNCHHDHRTRETHLIADGQVVGVNDPFIVGGAQLMYPSDPSGPPEEIEGCRCVMTGQGRHEAIQ